MRKVFLHMNMSLDGFIEDADRQIDWHFADDESDAYIVEMLRSIDGMIFGRVSHEMLGGYWPAAAEQPGASAATVEMAALMAQLPKYVITRSAYETDWENSHVISGDIAGALKSVKSEPGRDIALFAGAKAAQSLIQLGLVDEFRIMLNPVILGGGTPLFAPGVPRVEMKLADTRTFRSGMQLLRYLPARVELHTAA